MLEVSKYSLDNFDSERDSFLKDIKIMATQLLMINMIFTSAVDSEKNTLFSIDRNHSDWKALYSITTRRVLGDA